MPLSSSTNTAARHDHQAVLARLEQEGYTDLRVCPLPPNEVLPAHTHDEHTVHIILTGGLEITDKTGKHVYHPGERVEFPAGTEHQARGLTDDGEMIVGIKKSV